MLDLSCRLTTLVGWASPEMISFYQWIVTKKGAAVGLLLDMMLDAIHHCPIWLSVAIINFCIGCIMASERRWVSTGGSFCYHGRLHRQI
ncbi:hypothetical protein ACLOJK_018414 [Asimina triloba]